MNITPKYHIGSKVYLSFMSYSLWSGQLTTVTGIRTGLTGGYYYTLEFIHMGNLTGIRDIAEHRLLPFYEDTYA